MDFEAEIPVFPLGLVGAAFSGLVFREEKDLHPKAYSEKELDALTHFYWSKKDAARPALFFDFEELEHVYELFG